MGRRMRRRRIMCCTPSAKLPTGLPWSGGCGGGTVDVRRDAGNEVPLVKRKRRRRRSFCPTRQRSFGPPAFGTHRGTDKKLRYETAGRSVVQTLFSRSEVQDRVLGKKK